MRHVEAIARLNPVAKSYLTERISCYVAALYKASAVMVGAAAESVVIELRDAVDARLTSLGQTPPRGLKDWKIKTIQDALKTVFDQKKATFPQSLRDEYEGYWAAFTQQIRAARNEAGHPSSVDPISAETIHGSLLIFPSLLKLASGLMSWVEQMV